MSYFSNYGPLVDVCAPGEGISSSVPGGGYGSKDGTSMASPHVAAVAAQIKSAHPEMNADEVVSAIKGSAASINVSNAGTGMAHLAAGIYALDPAANASGYNNHFVSSGNYVWTVDGNSVVSGNAGVNSSTSAMKTELNVGPEQTVTFDYKVSSEQNADYFRVKANGVTVFEASGQQDWQTASAVIPGSGSVTLSFEFTKNASGAAGSDKVWLRNIKVDGSLTSAANITGGSTPFASSGQYPWIVSRTENAAMSGNAGVNNSESVMTTGLTLKKGMIVTFKYKVDAASGDTFIFKCYGRTVLTSGATEGFVDCDFTVPSTGDHEFSFIFKKDASGSAGADCAYVKCFDYYHTFESAVNGTDDFLPFNNSYEYVWAATEDYATSTNWSASGTQSYFTLELEMQAGETLSFRYRSSSESNYDYFRFFIDGNQYASCSGSNSWTTYTFTANASRSYVFRWSYEKDSSVDSGDDAAYVDDVIYSGVYNVIDGDALAYCKNAQNWSPSPFSTFL